VEVLQALSRRIHFGRWFLPKCSRTNAAKAFID
jgi:hypothetical protein